MISGLDTNTHQVSFNLSTDQERQPFFENICAFDNDDKLLIGQDAKEYADSADVRAGNPAVNGNVSSLMRYLKLGICEDINVDRLANKDSAGLGKDIMRKHLNKIHQTAKQRGMKGDTYKLVAMFIKRIWAKYVLPAVMNQYKMTHPNINEAGFEIVLTRPSMWGFVEDQRYIRAAEAAFAGESVRLTNIAVFDEAHAVLAGMMDDSDTAKALKIGNIVIVPDIGGGTADLASVRIHSKRPLCLRDAAVPSSGGVFGATIGVSHFEQTTQSLLKPVYEEVSSMNLGARNWQRLCQELVKSFERKMKDYEGCSQSEGPLDLGIVIANSDIPAVKNEQLASTGYIMAEDVLRITHQEVQRLFGDCIDGIVGLTRAQILATEEKLETNGKGHNIRVGRSARYISI